MKNTTKNFRAVLFVVAILSALVVTGPAFAAQPVTSSLMVPLDGLVFAPGGGYENVVLTGRVQLVTQFTPGDPCQPGDPCRVFVNLADVTGIGTRSGLDYVAIGAMNVGCAPGDPCAPRFVIMPVAVPPDPITPPNPILSIGLVVTIGFDQSGHLSPDGTTVALPSCSVDFGC